MRRNQSGFKTTNDEGPGSLNTRSGSDRWDHNGYDQVYKDENKCSKDITEKVPLPHNNVDRDSNNLAPKSKSKENKTPVLKSREMWPHDKCVTDELLVLETDKKKDINLKKEKKPDIPLYRPRKNTDTDKRQPSTVISANEEKNVSIEKTKQGEQGEREYLMKPGAYKKENTGYDDTTSVTSNTSTNVSDKAKCSEEKMDFSRSGSDEAVCNSSDNPPTVDEIDSAVILELHLGRDIQLKIYQGQYDYAQIIKNFVAKLNYEEDFALQLELFIASKLNHRVKSRKLEEHHHHLMQSYIQLITRRGSELGYDKDLIACLTKYSNNPHSMFTRS